MQFVAFQYATSQQKQKPKQPKRKPNKLIHTLLKLEMEQPMNTSGCMRRRCIPVQTDMQTDVQTDVQMDVYAQFYSLDFPISFHINVIIDMGWLLESYLIEEKNRT